MPYTIDWAQRTAFEHFHPVVAVVAVDPAKPGFDVTSAQRAHNAHFAQRAMAESYDRIKQEMQKLMYADAPLKDVLTIDDGRRATPADLAKPAAPNPDHIWDMLVLAARASRYEQE